MVDLISNSLRYRKMPAMLYPRCNEKLLDALLSLSEIIRLVGYSEHVPYGLLNPGHGRATCDPGTAACGSIPRLCSLCWHFCSTTPTVSKSVVHRLLKIGLAKRFRLLAFRDCCRLLFTNLHRVPQAMMQVSQAVHETVENKTSRVDACRWFDGLPSA